MKSRRPAAVITCLQLEMSLSWGPCGLGIVAVSSQAFTCGCLISEETEGLNLMGFIHRHAEIVGSHMHRLETAIDRREK